MRVSRISIGRVYNLGNYEHVRYELMIEVPEGESAATAMLGAEKIIAAMKPDRVTPTWDEICRRQAALAEDRTLSLAAFERRHGQPVGGPEAYLKRVEEGIKEDIQKREQSDARHAKARKLLEDLGGAANWKDAKLDWEDNE